MKDRKVEWQEGIAQNSRDQVDNEEKYAVNRH